MPNRVSKYDDAQIYYVEWLDSKGRGGWCSVESAPCDDLRCKSVGWLVEDTEDSVTIAPSLASTGSVFAPITIPRCAITRLREVTF